MRKSYSALRRQLFFALLAVGSLLWFASSISAAPGDLDLSFGKGGKVVTSFGSGESSIKSVALQSDNKIVAGGCGFNGTNYDFALARYNADGSLDPTFGNGGKVLTDIDQLNECIYGIGIQPDGKIVAAGQRVGTVTAGNAYFILVRYNANGTLDNLFGVRGDGIVLTDPTGITGGKGWCGVNAVAIQPDGKIVAVGWAWIYPFDYTSYFTLVRYTTNGSLDALFGQNGIVTTGFNETSEASPFTVAVQSDGRIVAAGVVSLPDGYAFGLARYNVNGSLDNSFGSGGKVITYLDEDRDAVAYNIAIQSDGKIVAAGYTHHEPGAVYRNTAVRYKTNGSLDTTFGIGGIVATLIRERSFASAVVIQSNGRIVEAGGTQGAASNDFGLARYNHNGLLDRSFGTGGTVVTSVRDGDDSINAALLQADGRIVVAGWSSNGKTLDFALARYMADAIGPRHASFDFDGDRLADISVFRPSDRVWYLNQSTVGFSAAQFGLSTDKITPADYDGDGKTDIAVYRDGIWYWLNSSNGSFNAFQFGLADDIPVPADYTGDGHAELAVYRSGVWYTWDLAHSQFNAVQFGISSDKPVPSDFDDDGKTDVAVYREGFWYWLRSSDNGFRGVQFGLASDKPVVGDYDGDGKSDQAVYRSGVWYILGSTQGFYGLQFGIASDIPVAADYDGDGKTDLAVYRDGIWYLLRSVQGFGAVQWGMANDNPIPTAFVP